MKHIAFFFVLFCLVFVTSCKEEKQNLIAENSVSHTSNKKNIVLILIDDLSHYGVTAYGADRVTSNRGLFKNAPISTP